MNRFQVFVSGASRLRATAAVLAVLALGACTTIEGTNALTDGATFEREVLRSTLQGIGVVEQQPASMPSINNAPLVVPGAGTAPPPPGTVAAAALPANSDTVMLDTAGLTTADLAFLRDGRVVDVGQVAGRPLTEAEARQLAARMQAYRQAQGIGQQRSLYLPPDSYFNRVGGQDVICLAVDGTLVSIDDPNCPPAVRAQLVSQG